MNTNLFPKRVVVVPSPQEIRDIHYQNRVRLAARNTGISSREFPDAIQRAILCFDGLIIQTDGDVWECPDIDELISDPRTLRNMLEVDSAGNFRRKEARQLGWIFSLSLYFKIVSPNIARHFGAMITP